MVGMADSTAGTMADFTAGTTVAGTTVAGTEVAGTEVDITVAGIINPK